MKLAKSGSGYLFMNDRGETIELTAPEVIGLAQQSRVLLDQLRPSLPSTAQQHAVPFLPSKQVLARPEVGMGSVLLVVVHPDDTPTSYSVPLVAAEELSADLTAALSKLRANPSRPN
jgi:hypothetical protein